MILQFFVFALLIKSCQMINQWHSIYFIKFIIKLNMRFRKNITPHHSLLFDQLHTCIVCGSQNCQESTTHNKVTLKQLKGQILQHQFDKQPQLPLTSLKNQVRFKYEQLKTELCNIINQKQREVQVWLNQFYFPKSYEKNKNFYLIQQIMQNSYLSLPSNKIQKLNKQIFKNSPPSQQEILDLQTMNQRLGDAIQKTKQFIYNLNIKKIAQQIGFQLQLSQIKQKILPDMKLLPKKSISTSDSSNPQQFQPLVNSIYEWKQKRIKIIKSTRVLQLSNKNISDQEVIERLPIMAHYKNIQEIQLRNNKISSLTCNIIANNFSFLKVVDIRSNKLIDDKGIIKIINGIPKLKSLLISQTSATDQTGIQVYKKLPELQVFWSEHNKISGEIAIKIAQKVRIKVLSLAGNPISQDSKQKIKKIMNPKGYVVI